MLPIADTDYCCPGETYPISRAVHLGRLAAYYPACRTCPRRHDAAGLPRSKVRSLAAAFASAPAPLFYDEGLCGLHGDELSADMARRAAGAFGQLLRRHGPADPSPRVLLAADERPLSAEIVAAVAEGLRYSGCGVVDLGGASAASLVHNIVRLEAQGGVLVGNPQSRPRTSGLKFWLAEGRPLPATAAQGPSLAAMQPIVEQPPVRPTRRSGSWQRLAGDDAYLQTLSPEFHALRPLRFVLDTGCAPLRRYVKGLLAHVGCQAIAGRLEALPEGVHFGIWIDGDGECCRLVDEQGQSVAWDRLLLLLARHLLSDSEADRDIRPTIVAAEEILPDEPSSELPPDSRQESAQAMQPIVSAGGRLVVAASGRQAMHRAMQQSLAVVGGEPCGRYWFGGGFPTCDALRVLALVLAILSQSDRPLSEVAGSLG